MEKHSFRVLPSRNLPMVEDDLLHVQTSQEDNGEKVKVQLDPDTKCLDLFDSKNELIHRFKNPVEKTYSDQIS